MDSQAAQVIVVGGGPAGAATAFHLARAGIHVTILDRAHFPRDKPCSEYMSPQASRILDEMGVLEQIERSGAAHLAGMRVHAPDGEGQLLEEFRAINKFAVTQRTVVSPVHRPDGSVGATEVDRPIRGAGFSREQPDEI